MREDSKNAFLAQNATALYKFSYPTQTAAIFRWICGDFISPTVENYATRYQQDRQCTYNVTLMHVPATIVPVEKQHTLSVRLQPLSRNSPHFMEPECSLPHSQASATCPYPKPEQSNPCLPILLLEDPF